MASNSSSTLSLAEQQALSWVAKITGTPLSVQAKADFAVWLQLDPSHAEHFEAAAELWELTAGLDQHQLSRLCELPEATSPDSSRDASKEANKDAATELSASLKTTLIVTEQAALDTLQTPDNAASERLMVQRESRLNTPAQVRLGTWLLLMLMSTLWLAPEPPTRYLTGTGEYERLPLEDGSVLHLNTNTRVNLRFTGHSRDLQLVRGELFIEVAHNPKRPLRVHTQALTANAVGTAFSVAATKERHWVHVANGQVLVSDRRADEEPVTPVSLTKGQRLGSVDQVLGKPEYSPQTVATWRHGQLLYRNLPLADLVADLNRYHAQKLIIHSASLRAQRVTAVLNATNFAEASTTLASSLGLKRQQLSDTAILLYEPTR